MESNFPSNSKMPKNTPPKAEKKVQTVVTGEVVQRKKSLGKRFKEFFFTGADNRNVMEYVLHDLLIPGARDVIADAASAGIHRKLYGDAGRPRGGYGRPPIGGPAGYVAYNRLSAGHPAGRAAPREDPRIGTQASRHARKNHDFGEIVIPTRVEADAVLEGLYELLSTYQQATVGDLYDMCNLDSSFTDQQWGWTSLHGATPVRLREGGYILSLPRPEPLD